MILDGVTGLPREYERTVGTKLRISWSDWAVRDGRSWPYRIEIRAGESREVLRVTLGRIRPGVSISEKTFEVEPDDSREILTPKAAQDRWHRIRL